MGFTTAGTGQIPGFFIGLPRTVVNHLVLNQTAGIIYAATFGRGIFYTTTYSPCITSQNLNSTISGEKVFEVSGTLTSGAVIGGGEQTKVFFKSNNEIRLTEGFLALDSITEFKATLGPCGSGFPELNNVGTHDSMHYIPVEVYPPSVLSGYVNGYLSINAKKGLQLILKKSGMVEIRFKEKRTGISTVVQPQQTLKAGTYSIGIPTKLQKSIGMIELYLEGNIIHIQESLN
jgi:hypothetical protein